MLDQLRLSDPLSRDMRDLNKRIVATVRTLTGVLGRPPEESEIAHDLKLPISASSRRAWTLAASVFVRTGGYSR